jgi:hypothetical protein
MILIKILSSRGPIDKLTIVDLIGIYIPYIGCVFVRKTPMACDHELLTTGLASGSKGFIRKARESRYP